MFSLLVAGCIFPSEPELAFSGSMRPIVLAVAVSGSDAVTAAVGMIDPGDVDVHGVSDVTGEMLVNDSTWSSFVETPDECGATLAKWTCLTAGPAGRVLEAGDVLTLQLGSGALPQLTGGVILPPAVGLESVAVAPLREVPPIVPSESRFQTQVELRFADLQPVRIELAGEVAEVHVGIDTVQCSVGLGLSGNARDHLEPDGVLAVSLGLTCPELAASADSAVVMVRARSFDQEYGSFLNERADGSDVPVDEASIGLDGALGYFGGVTDGPALRVVARTASG